MSVASEEEILRKICESGSDFQRQMASDEKSKLREIFNETSTAGSTLNSTIRRTRKDFTSRNSLSKNFRGPQSASPLYKNRGHEEEESDSNDEMEPDLDEFDDEDLQNYHDQCSYNPHDIIENDMEEDSLTDSAPTAPTCDEGDPNMTLEAIEDLKKYDLKD